MQKSEIKNAFENPSPQFRGKPFWAWNGKLEEKELRRQIKVMKDMGFGGFFMHSRSGLETEYLGKEWFELVSACTDEAKKLDMEAWLYDEDRWPSGSAGGKATQEDKYRMKYLRLTIHNSADYKFNDDAVAVFLCSLDGLSFTDCKQITSCELLQPNLSVLEFTVEQMLCDSFYNDQTYLDTMSAEATEHFLNITHEKYKECCGEEFGKTIKGMFTDEPHRGMLMSKFYAAKDAEWLVPYTPKLFDEFKSDFGYCLKENLPELFLWKEGEKVSQVKWHYVEILQRLFLKNFALPMQKWCRDNNLLLTGHVLHEDTLATQTVPCGSVMRYYEYMDYPGVDVLTEMNRNYWIAKQLDSAARQLGKKWLLSELYGCSGWQMTLQNYKATGDWQSLFGITLRCPHLSWYTMKGQAKRDYPASIMHQSTWYKEYEALETYFSRLQLLLTQGEAACDVLVINPIESVWAQIYPGCFDVFEPTNDTLKQLQADYEELFFILTQSHIDFDYGDEDMLNRLGSVDGKALKIGKADYKCVIVPPMTTIRKTTLELLNRFSAAGGKVIFTGEPSDYVDALKSDEAKKLARSTQSIPFDRQEIVKTIKNLTSPLAEITDAATGKDIADIFCQVKISGNDIILVALNVSTENSFENVSIKLNAQGYPQIWDCRNGSVKLADHKTDGDAILINTSFTPSQELAIVVSKTIDPSAAATPAIVHKGKTQITGDFDYSLSEPNICVLDYARYKIADNHWQEELEVLKVDRQIRKHLGLRPRSGQMLQPWCRGKNETTGTPVAIEFGFDIDHLPQSDMILVIEEPEIFNIFVNDKPLDKQLKNDFWLDICFKKLVLPINTLQLGKNTIRLELSYNDDRGIEALYLLGDFGVSLAKTNKTITKLPKKLTLGDITHQGLPFYSGKLAYKLNTQSAGITASSHISIGNTGASCIKIKDGSNNEKLLPFEPYTTDIQGLDIDSGLAIELVLTRRNTFGPLHLNRPIETTGFKQWFGPDEFETTGDTWSDDYCLIEQGLLSEPIIRN